LLGLSRGASMVLFLLYLAFLAFQLHTHKDIYEERSSYTPKPSENIFTPLHESIGATQIERDEEAKVTEEKEDDDDDELGFRNALIWLAIATALIALLSEALSASIQKAADSAGVSGVFIAAIVLPIVGNAAEHAGAVMFAMKGKLDLTLGVAIGSSTQISLCVLPFVVLIAWMIDKPLDLDFGAFEGSSLLLTILTVTFIIKDGNSNWLLGAALIGAYFIIAIAFLTHINEPLDA